MTQTTSDSQRPAYRMAAMLIGIGVGHFLAPKPFDTIVPAELPGSARFYTLASGVAEVGVGAGLLLPRTRRASALAAVALFLAVFPANVNMVRLWKDKPLPMRIAALARLPLQIPMIVAALKVRKAAPPARSAQATLPA
ncbi:MAG: DoxX family protein [Mycobacterium sp.]